MIHPTAVIGEPPEHRDWRLLVPGVAPEIADSALVEALVTVDAGVHHATRVGERTWLMKKVHVGHDAQIGDDCELAPLTSVGGHVRIGNRVRVGQGAVFRPFVTIGDRARIGAGAVVVKDVPAGETWAGNPARPLRRPATGEVLTMLEELGWEEFAHAMTSRELDLWHEWWYDSRRGSASQRD